MVIVRVLFISNLVTFVLKNEGKSNKLNFVLGSHKKIHFTNGHLLRCGHILLTEIRNQSILPPYMCRWRSITVQHFTFTSIVRKWYNYETSNPCNIHNPLHHLWRISWWYLNTSWKCSYHIWVWKLNIQWNIRPCDWIFLVTFSKIICTYKCCYFIPAQCKFPIW